MAFTGLLALLDDITTMLDDIAVMSQTAAQKTAGVLGDDLALNAQQVTGVSAKRELPVVWAVAKGSFKNKLILVPAALLISAMAPWLIVPLLMLGGAYLCFEGFEKVWHLLFPHVEYEAHASKLHHAMQHAEADLMQIEREKIRGAIRTDFVLSAEIIVIALGVVKTTMLVQQVLVLSLIAVLMTVGVYGLVAIIVKMDDAGLYLSGLRGSSLLKVLLRKSGNLLVSIVPYLMQMLSLLGTAAMFVVGGGIVMHGVVPLHELASAWPTWLFLLQAATGMVTGACCLLIYRIGMLIVVKH